MIKHIAVAALLTIGALNSKAQEPTDVWVTEFFAGVEKGNIDPALTRLFSHMVNQASASDAVENLRGQLTSTIKLIGDYHGYRKLARRDLGGALVIEDYMVLYDRQPLRFRFEFYRADKEWSLYSFSFDADLDEDLEEAIKKLDYFAR